MAGNRPVNATRRLVLFFIILSVFPLSARWVKAADGPNLIANPGFEDAPNASATFSLFTASDSEEDHCRFTVSPGTFHSGKQSALMQADDFARFALGPQSGYPVVAGDLYRVGVWVKAGADFQKLPGSSGVVLRLDLTTGSPPVPATGGLTFINLDSTASQAGPPDFAPPPAAASVPTQWTHLEAVVKVPAGVDSIRPELFFWKAKGSLYVDDFNLQKVDPATPVTPLVGATPAPASP